MHDQHVFIGRAKELNIIEEMLFDPENGRHMLPIVGQAGCGKTWFLRELYRRYRNDDRILVACIDYSLSRPQSLPTLSINMVEQFGPHMTDEQQSAYHQHMADWRTLVETELDPDKIRNEQNKIYHFCIDLIWQISQTRRMLILCDAIDAENALEDIQRTSLLAANLPNTVILFAGRPTPFTHRIYAELKNLYKRWQGHETYELDFFSHHEAVAYFEAESAGGTREEREKIFILTGGHPVLVATSSGWLKKQRSLPEEVAAFSLDQFRTFDEIAMGPYRRQFERSLVEDIGALQSPVDRAVLYLSLLNQRYDPDILAIAMEIDDTEERDHIVAELQSLVFVRRTLLSESGGLHESIQRLLKNYVWPEVDPDRSLRQSLAQRVIDTYYLPEIERLETIVQEKLAQSLNPAMVTAEHRDKLPVPDEYWPKRDLQMECLYYQFAISEVAGWQYLNQLFDDALTHHYSLIQMDAIVQAVYKLAPQQVNSEKFQVRLAQILFEKGEIERAVNAVEKALDSSEIEPADASKAFIILADSTTDPAEKVTHFKVALEMAEAAEDPVLELRVLNRLGLAYRRQGHWNEAEAAYLQVLHRMDETEEPNQFAATLNNLAFVYMLNGNPTRADNLAEKALRIRREQGNIHGLGFSYSTRGRIAESLGDYVTALRYHRTAVDLCELVGDTNNAALMKVNVAAGECHAQQFEKAHLLLSPALRSDMPNIRARALQQAARIDVEEAKALTSQGASPTEIEAKYVNAERAASESLELARGVLDDHLVASVLLDLLFIIFLKDQRKDEQHSAALQEILKDHNYKLEKGRLMELEGNLAYVQDHIPQAFAHYLDACEMLAQYSLASFRHVFEQVRDRFLDMGTGMQQQICQMIEERYATVQSGSLLIALKELCIGEIIGFSGR